MSKFLSYPIITIFLISTSIYQVVFAATPTTTTKTYQDFGLGFRIEYPYNLVLNKSSDNVTLAKPYSHSRVIIYVDTWGKLLGLSGPFTPPNLDTAARHIGLALSNSNVTVTNKTKLTVGNTTAYVFQGYRNDYGHIFHVSTYLMLKGDVVYRLIFRGYNLNESLPIEKVIVKSFRFI